MTTLTHSFQLSHKSPLRVPASVYGLVKKLNFSDDDLAALCGRPVKSSDYCPDAAGQTCLDWISFTAQRSQFSQVQSSYNNDETSVVWPWNKHDQYALAAIIDEFFKFTPKLSDLLYDKVLLPDSEKNNDNIFETKHSALKYWRSGNGRHFYNQSLSNPLGIIIYSQTNPSSKNYPTLHVDIPGSALKGIPFYQQVLFIKKLHALGIKFTRIDAVIDVFDRDLLDIDDIEKAAIDDNFCNARKRRIVQAFEDGMTIYFGSRQSNKYVRFYNASLKHCPEVVEAAYKLHNVEVYWLRCEMELKRDAAKVFARNLVRVFDNISTSDIFSEGTDDKYLPVINFFKSTLVSCVDFVDRKNGETHLDRCDRLSWWENFIDGNYKIKLNDDELDNTSPVEKAQKWINRQVASSLYGLSLWFETSEKFYEYIEEVKDNFLLRLLDKCPQALEQFAHKWCYNSM